MSNKDYLHLRCGNYHFLLNAEQVEEITVLPEQSIDTRSFCQWREKTLPLLDLRELLSVAPSAAVQQVIVSSNSKKGGSNNRDCAISIDEVVEMVSLADEQFLAVPAFVDGEFARLVNAAVVGQQKSSCWLRLDTDYFFAKTP